MILLDTDILIDVQRGFSPAIEWLASLSELPSVPGFVVMGLIQGANNTRQVRQALKLVSPFQVVWPSEEDCRRALSDFAILRLSHSLGLLDALIAACAVGYSATLFSSNIKHYQAVPDLHVEAPYRRTTPSP